MSRPPRAGTEVPRAPGFLDALPEASRRALIAGAVERRFAADEVLFLAGTEARFLHLVLEGRVRVVREPGGRPHVIQRGGCTCATPPCR